MEKETFEQKEQEKTFIIDIHFSRRLVAVLIVLLLVAAGVGALALGPERAIASSSAAPDSVQSSSGARQYYMTDIGYLANDATTACAAGYHMASLWEILDPSGLEYNTSLGHSRADSGQGPPSGYAGWVHTGYSNNIDNIPGRANCNGWSSNDPFEYGTIVGLAMEWAQTADFGGIWETMAVECDTGGVSVWCVED